jgi:hypothetical protein
MMFASILLNRMMLTAWMVELFPQFDLERENHLTGKIRGKTALLSVMEGCSRFQEVPKSFAYTVTDVEGSENFSFAGSQPDRIHHLVPDFSKILPEFPICQRM